METKNKLSEKSRAIRACLISLGLSCLLLVLACKSATDKNFGSAIAEAALATMCIWVAWSAIASTRKLDDQLEGDGTRPSYP